MLATHFNRFKLRQPSKTFNFQKSIRKPKVYGHPTLHLYELAGYPISKPCGHQCGVSLFVAIKDATLMGRLSQDFGVYL